MPDRRSLRIGDRIRLLSIPVCDVEQRERELARATVDSDSNATVIERIMATDPIVTILRIDEFGSPWFEVEIEEDDGIHYHLSQVLSRNLMSDFPKQVAPLLNEAHHADAGEAAVQQLCNASLGDRVAQFLGSGSWKPARTYSAIE